MFFASFTLQFTAFTLHSKVQLAPPTVNICEKAQWLRNCVWKVSPHLSVILSCTNPSMNPDLESSLIWVASVFESPDRHKFQSPTSLPWTRWKYSSQYVKLSTKEPFMHRALDRCSLVHYCYLIWSVST